MGDLPLMTDKGTFIINGAEGLWSAVGEIPRGCISMTGGRSRQHIIRRHDNTQPGAWFELEMDSAGVIYTRIDKTRKIPVTVLLRCIGFESNEAILALY